MVAFGDLFRAALPDTWTNGAWRSMNTPIIVDGVARNNAAVKCVGHHYKLGHEVRVDGNTLTYVTWTLENQEIKKNTVYEFAVDGAALTLMSGSVNLFCCGWVDDPTGELAEEILSERVAHVTV